MITFLEKNFWLSLVLLAALGVLLSSLLGQLGGDLPPLKRLQDRVQPSPRRLIERRVDEWFSVTSLTRVATVTNATSPFYTLHFQPPPPPRTRRVDLLYLGCLQFSTGGQLACVKVGDATLTLTNGAKVIMDYAIKSVEVSQLTLTNAAGQTNLLQFRVVKPVDVPL